MVAFVNQLASYFSNGMRALYQAVFDPQVDKAASEQVAAAGRQEAPVIWLLGKVAAGKSSIVQRITGSTEAEIGEGFRACTRTSQIYDFPAAAPVARFLDTRGLGEAQYDPTEDIGYCEAQAHLVLVVMRAMDPVQQPVIEALTQVRKRHPEWPVIVIQTCLHEGYPHGKTHALPYPYDRDPQEWGKSVPQDLQRALVAQRQLFKKIPGKGQMTFAAVDFTRAGDGFEPEDYGVDLLLEAIEQAAPVGMELFLRTRGKQLSKDTFSGHALPHVLGYATAAGAVDLAPAVGLVAVPVVQGKMLHSLAAIYGTAWDKNTFGEFAGCLGSGFALRYVTELLLRQATKLIPWWGQAYGAVSAASISFATTYGLGRAACHYLGLKRTGATVDSNKVAEVYAKALSEALDMARRRTKGDSRRGK